MKILGIDLGSRSVKAVIFEDNTLLDRKIYDTSAFYRDFCTNIDGKINVNFESLDLGQFDKVISTGYGRNNIKINGAEAINELKAHSFGAVWQTGLKNFTLLDVGGQDSKVISIVNGKMSDMLLNDKCAASCGRYLENMASVLGMKLNEMSEYFESPVELSSTCAVFGESELIGRISEGLPLEHLAAGVNYSLFKRIKPLLERFPGECLVITGGVAQNDAFIKYAKEELEFGKVLVPQSPQFNGAIGCCAYQAGRL